MAKKKIKKSKSTRPAKKKRPAKVSRAAQQPKAVIEINHDWCKGCYICIESCPQAVFAKSDKLNNRGFHSLSVAKAFACTKCLECEMLCPDLAITIQ